MHFQSWFSLYFCNDGCFEVFLASSLQELFSIFLGNNHCHSVLRFTDGNFCAIQTVILLRHSVQVNFQTVGQFAAEVRGKRPPEPYKGKGVKYSDERILRKAGKAGK